METELDIVSYICLLGNFGSNRAYPANTQHSANNSQNVPDLLLLYENICITFGEYSISGNIIHMFYECFHFNNAQSTAGWDRVSICSLVFYTRSVTH